MSVKDDKMNPLKAKIKKLADQNPEKFYPVSVIKELGYERHQCKKCGTFFWSQEVSDVCGEPECSGGYKFVGNPVGKEMDFIQGWSWFRDHMAKRGYTPIKRYPLAARWRDDTDFVQASIYDFQPHVVTGEADPPANPLVVPQYCARFNEIENIGITGRHKTGFVMIGQHAFKSLSEFEQEKYFKDYHDWFTLTAGIPKEELKIHESQWAGGGNAGTSMEFFAKGLELGNQVYMTYEVKGEDELVPLSLKVLDMGMGQARTPWLTQGSSNIFEVSYPDVCQKLYQKTGVRPTGLYEKFIPYGSILDVDSDVELEKAWQEIANKLGEDVKTLKGEVLPVAAMFSIADHTQTLLVALNDGVLPSNAGGGYNLRVILRRALGFIHRYGWNLNLPEVCYWHAEYLKPQYPELMENLEEVAEILEHEEKKYKASREKASRKVETLLKIKGDFSFNDLRKLYESDGITPEMLKEAAERQNKGIRIPDDFYLKLEEVREKEKKEETKQRSHYPVEGIPPTEKLFYEPIKEFDARVLKTFEQDGRHFVVLDKTAFYAVGGGQDCDHGTLNNIRVFHVLKQGEVIIHETEKPVASETVHGIVDWKRRMQLTKNHTATHIINGAARQLLGSHVWQAGAEKTVEKARLDITHYEQLSEEQVQKIQEIANQVVNESRPVIKTWMPRTKAEQAYGFRLYQGGAVPGKTIRVVEVKDFDVEACAGTHLDNTKEAEEILILRTKKIQDGIVRIEFVAGHEVVEKEKQKKRKEKEKRKDALLKRAVKLTNEIFKLGGKLPEENLRKLQAEEILEKIKELEKQLVRLKEEKTLKTEYDYPVVQVNEPDMKVLEKIGGKLLQKFGYGVVIGPGVVFGVKTPESQARVEEAVKKAAEVMDGKAGGKGNEWKGGGPEKEKFKEAAEIVKRFIMPENN